MRNRNTIVSGRKVRVGGRIQLVKHIRGKVVKTKRVSRMDRCCVHTGGSIFEDMFGHTKFDSKGGYYNNVGYYVKPQPKIPSALDMFFKKPTGSGVNKNLSRESILNEINKSFSRRRY